MEVLVERDVVAPSRVVLQLRRPSRGTVGGRRARAGTARSAAPAGRRRRRPGDCVWPLPVGYSISAVAAERSGVALQVAQHQVVDRHPDRPAPVGVAAEHAGARLAGLVVDGDVRTRPGRPTAGGPRGTSTAPAARTARGTRSRRTPGPARGGPRRGGTTPTATASVPGTGTTRPRPPSGAPGSSCPRKPAKRFCRVPSVSSSSGPRTTMPISGQHADDGPDLDRDRRAVAGVEDVVEEAVLLVPQPLGVHGVDDQHEVLDELHLDVGPGVVLARPGSWPSPAGSASRTPSSWCRRPARAGPPAGRWDRSMALMLSRPRNPPAKRWSPSGSIRLTHQVKFISSLGNRRAEEVGVTAAVDVPHVQRRPGVHGRVGVAERPLVGRQRTVGVLEPLAAHHQQLVLGERRVDVGQGDGVEGQVPGGEPRVLPRVGHRQDVAGVHVEPAGVAAAATLAVGAAAGSGRRRASASRRSGRTACPRSSRRRPDGRRAARRRRRRRGSPRRRTRRPRRCRVASTSSNSVPNAGDDDGERRRTRTTWVSPGATVRRYHAGRLRSVASPGSPSAHRRRRGR